MNKMMRHLVTVGQFHEIECDEVLFFLNMDGKASFMKEINIMECRNVFAEVKYESRVSTHVGSPLYSVLYCTVERASFIEYHIIL